MNSCNDLKDMPVDIFDAGFIGEDPFANGPTEMNLDFNVTDGELQELDANELESLLSTYENMDAAEILFGNQEHTETAPNCNSTSSTPPRIVLEDFPRSNICQSEDPEFSKRKDTNSVLLISIPEPMQDNAAFDAIPSVNLERRFINKIAEASSGHDGVYLPINHFADPDEMIVRRIPLRVIHQINNRIVFKAPDVPLKSEPCKRKQTFNLVRDDRVVFSVEAPRLRPKDSIRKTPRDSCFKWASTDEEETEDANEEADEGSKRCPGCKKVFKKLIYHKCKKLNPIVDLTRLSIKQEVDTNSLMFCGSCHKPFKSKKGLVAHMKRCVTKKVAEKGTLEPVIHKRSLRSQVKK